MKTLKKVHKGFKSGCCECYMLCGLFKILFGHSCCQSYKVSDGSEKKKLKENGNNTAEKWENLCSNEIISITQRDINKMVKNVQDIATVTNITVLENKERDVPITKPLSGRDCCSSQCCIF